MSCAETLPSGFVYLHQVIPDIQVSLRYATEENFVGAIIDGYYDNVSIMTERAALALKQVQKTAQDHGYELVIYDSYRPQKSVNHFSRWSKDETDSQIKKDSYYPRTNKEETFQLGYIAAKSGHTRGSTVDLTIIERGKRVRHPLTPKERVLQENLSFLYLDDGTVDMGSSFDLLDPVSSTDSPLIDDQHRKMRLTFKSWMEAAGFKNYAKEWWHFTFIDEPFPDTYFDFDVKSTYQTKPM